MADDAVDEAAAQLHSMAVSDAVQTPDQQPGDTDGSTAAAIDDAERQDAPPAEPAAPVLTDPDGIVEHCLLAGLLAVTDEELPMMLSDFYSKHMLANKPDGGPPPGPNLGHAF